MNIQSRKTKILATIGPAIYDKSILETIVKEHLVDGFRFNFSHVDYEKFKDILKIINQLMKKYKNAVALVADLQGPKIRIGNVKDNSIILEKGKKIVLTEKKVLGTPEILQIGKKGITKKLKLGNRILINDGLVRLEVCKINKDSVKCRIIEGGLLSSRKGVNLPDTDLKVSALTSKDKRDVEFILQHNFNYIALSFVSCVADVQELRKLVKKKIDIISKIERISAVECIKDIAFESNGIMIARGDLGIETSLINLPIIQKDIMEQGLLNNSFTITATQMLESMVHNPIPTRAEVNDVANSIIDGTDVVMLSAETSIGSYPLETLNFINDVIVSVERSKYIKQSISKYDLSNNQIDFSIAHAAITAQQEALARYIVVRSNTGKSAKLLSKRRPAAPIIMITNNVNAFQKSQLYYNVIPIMVNKSDFNIEQIKKYLLKKSIIKEPDKLVFVNELTDKNNIINSVSIM